MTTEICGHNVKWHVKTKSVKELTDFEQDRIADLIKEGYTQGELCMSYTTETNRHYETRGWWEIVNWQDIALELYNALKGSRIIYDEQNDKVVKKAIKRFDKNWE